MALGEPEVDTGKALDRLIFLSTNTELSREVYNFRSSMKTKHLETFRSTGFPCVLNMLQQHKMYYAFFKCQ